MDPGTRRFMWNFLDGARQDKAILLTTHSMEEADALCNKIAIMTKGSIRAEGTAQELKEKYGEGYLITIRKGEKAEPQSQTEVGVEDSEGDSEPNTIQELIEGINADSRAMSGEFSILKYVVPKQGCSLADIFERVQAHRDRLGILDFAVSQTTLEDIFLYFADQEGEEN